MPRREIEAHFLAAFEGRLLRTTDAEMDDTIASLEDMHEFIGTTELDLKAFHEIPLGVRNRMKALAKLQNDCAKELHKMVDELHKRAVKVSKQVR